MALPWVGAEPYLFIQKVIISVIITESQILSLSMSEFGWYIFTLRSYRFVERDEILGILKNLKNYEFTGWGPTVTLLSPRPWQVCQLACLHILDCDITLSCSKPSLWKEFLKRVHFHELKLCLHVTKMSRWQNHFSEIPPLCEQGIKCISLVTVNSELSLKLYTLFFFFFYFFLTLYILLVQRYLGLLTLAILIYCLYTHILHFLG